MIRLRRNIIVQNLHRIYSNLKHKVLLRSINYEYEKAISPSLNLQQLKEYNKYRSTYPQKIFCNAPFTSLYFNHTGKVTACGYNKFFVLGDITKDKMHDIWNSKKQQELQQAILNYNLEKGCQLCLQKVQTKDYHRAGLYYDNPSYDHSNLLRKVTFELSNTCNLECIMCNGELSSKIRKNRELKPPIKSPYRDEFVNDISPYLKNIKLAQFLGGEPLLIQIYYSLWEKIILNNKSCKISLQTNATLLPLKFKEFLKSQQFIIGVSIDSFKKDRFEMIRTGAIFEEVMKNVDEYLKLKNEGLIEMSINFVPMNINSDEIPDALSFANNNNINLSLCEVEFPYEYTFKSLSSKKLSDIICYLEKNTLTIRPHFTSCQKQNIKVYNDHILQLKNLLEIIKIAETKFPLESSKSIPELKDSYLQEIEKYFSSLSTEINNLINGLLSETHDEYEYKTSLILLNQYFVKRELFFKEHKGINNSLDLSLQNIVINEFRSITNYIKGQVLT